MSVHPDVAPPPPDDVSIPPSPTADGCVTASVPWSAGLARPRAFLRAAAVGEARPTWFLPLVAYGLVTALLVREVLFRAFFLWRIAPGSTWRRVSEAVAQHVRDDLWFWWGAWAFLLVVGRLLFAGTVSARARVVVVFALLWPLLVGKVIGAGLSLLGHDFWWLPHHPVRSWAIVERGEVMWWRYGLKCAVSYGMSACAGLLLVWDLWRERGGGKPPLTQNETPSETSSRQNRWVLPGLQTLKILQGACAFLAIAVFGLGGWDLARREADLRPLLPGDPLPDRQFALLIPQKNVRTIATADLRGKILVLDFWASFCLPCRRSIPEMSSGIAEAYPAQVVVLGVNQERDRKAARAMWQSLKPRFESVMDPGDWGHRLGITSLPTTLVVDAAGIVRHVHIGYTEIEVLQREIATLLSP